MSTVLNSGGNHPSFVAAIRDAGGSGVAITVAAAATPQVVKGAAFEERSNRLPGFTWVAADGRLTLSAPVGASPGRYQVSVHERDVIGTNAKFNFLQVNAKQKGEAAALVGGPARRTELATATRGGLRFILDEVELTKEGDFVEVLVGVETDGNAVTFRGLELQVLKIGE